MLYLDRLTHTTSGSIAKYPLNASYALYIQLYMLYCRDKESIQKLRSHAFTGKLLNKKGQLQKLHRGTLTKVVKMGGGGGTCLMLMCRIRRLLINWCFSCRKKA